MLGRHSWRRRRPGDETDDPSGSQIKFDGQDWPPDDPRGRAAIVPVVEQRAQLRRVLDASHSGFQPAIAAGQNGRRRYLAESPRPPASRQTERADLETVVNETGGSTNPERAHPIISSSRRRTIRIHERGETKPPVAGSYREKERAVHAKNHYRCCNFVCDLSE